MFRHIVVIVVFTVMGMVSAQDSATTPSVCATGCVNGVIVNAANIGCPNGDTICVCGKTESFHDGIRDCIAAACAPDGPDVQIPLAVSYGDQICAAANAPAPAPSSSTAIPPPEPTSADDVPASSTPVPSVDSASQSTVVSTTTASAETSAETIVSATDKSQPTSTASPSSTSEPSLESSASPSPTASASTAASSSTTKSGASEPAATSDTSDTSPASPASPGLSTAAKAGIGAGVGAVALAGIIIALCTYLQRRQGKKSANRVRNYKISEPMSSTDHQFANDIGRAETALPKPIITTRLAPRDSTALPISPTSVYSNASDLENHARRYEDMLPRTQPRTMI